MSLRSADCACKIMALALSFIRFREVSRPFARVKTRLLTVLITLNKRLSGGRHITNSVVIRIFNVINIMRMLFGCFSTCLDRR